MVQDALTEEVIGCAIEVHKTLGGPGLLESVYEEALAWELERHGMCVERQVTVPIRYKETHWQRRCASICSSTDN